jgi:DNA mismatch endonuclease (patch repair protein)
MGLRYRIDAKPLTDSPRRADLVFRRAKVAVFLDGCFWHGCSVHGSWPRTNREFWRRKILTNRGRDAQTTRQLSLRGWLAIRAWEHEDPHVVAKRVARCVLSRVKGE